MDFPNPEMAGMSADDMMAKQQQMAAVEDRRLSILGE